MNKMHVNANGEIELDADMLTYLDLQTGEDVIFFEKDGRIVIVNAARPEYRIILCKSEAPAIRWA